VNFDPALTLEFLPNWKRPLAELGISRYLAKKMRVLQFTRARHYFQTGGIRTRGLQIVTDLATILVSGNILCRLFLSTSVYCNNPSILEKILAQVNFSDPWENASAFWQYFQLKLNKTLPYFT